MSKTVLVTTSSFAEQGALLQAGLAVRVNPHGRKLTEEEALGLLKEHRPLGMIAGLEPLTRKVLESAAGHLKVISRCGTGMENVDLEAASALRMRVFNTPEAPAQAVAELTIGLMLAVSRRMAEADRALRAGTWKSLQGSLLGGKTVGIAGFGRIGSRVAALAAAFGCRVLACDERDFSASGVRRVSLDELLAASDIVTLHVPLDKGTRRMLDKTRLAAMKRGAILINVSRGGLLDEGALAAALAAGQLAGAGLDVFENEPYAGPLTDLPNVVLTCHMGSAAKESRAAMEREAAFNLIEGLRKEGLL